MKKMKKLLMVLLTVIMTAGMTNVDIFASETASAERKAVSSYTEEDLMYLTSIIYCEARGQSYKGKIAVANVIINRMNDEKVFNHVDTIKEVIYDCERWGRQFSPAYVKKNGKWTTKGTPMEEAMQLYKSGKFKNNTDRDMMEDSKRAAKAAFNGKQAVSEKAIYFNANVSSTRSKCKKKGIPYVVIGGHIFYNSYC